jgi:hypothetical protein
MLLMRPHPWLPKRLLRYSFSRERLTKTVEKARPFARWTEKVVGPRLSFLTDPPFLNVVAGVCVLLALLFFPLNIIPFAVAAPSAAVLLFGLAITARDGLLVLVGLAATGLAVGLLIYLWPF